MLNRALSVVVVALLTLQGCTSTVYYAVVAPREAVNDDQGCFRQCQLIHAGETKQYLACLHHCPGIRVVDDKQCNEVPLDADQYQCSTAHAQKFNPTAGILMIALATVAMIGIAVSASHSPSQTQ
jgi:hypothetical protein